MLVDNNPLNRAVPITGMARVMGEIIVVFLQGVAPWVVLLLLLSAVVEHHQTLWKAL
jgi:Na+/serine symporter